LVSDNVLVFTNPHWLKAAPAAGPTDLASAGLSADSASSKCLEQTKVGAAGRSVNTVLA